MSDRRWTNDANLPPVGDEAMRAALSATRPYTVAILRDGPRADHPDRGRLLWEHGRRNFRLRAAGLLPVVLPIRDDGEVGGVAVFDLGLEETRAVLAADPAVQAGLFTVDLHATRSFPGDRLPDHPERRAASGDDEAVEAVERFHRDGTLWARGFLLGGDQHGDWEWFRVDGSRMRSGTFDRGTQVGVWTTYDRDGSVVKRTRFPGPAGSPTDHTTDDQHAGDV